ncbi:MAG: hypothetical protein CM1200mP34_3720 [Verrucomicrobiales bacterium]|nr:MAG: hypothetical protein CM1200mP34_3720 [Verrucomicrobiales bacterium]
MLRGPPKVREAGIFLMSEAARPGNAYARKLRMLRKRELGTRPSGARGRAEKTGGSRGQRFKPGGRGENIFRVTPRASVFAP